MAFWGRYIGPSLFCSSVNLQLGTHTVVSHKTGWEIKIGTETWNARKWCKERLKARERGFCFKSVYELATPEGHEEENSSSRGAASSSLQKKRQQGVESSSRVKPWQSSSPYFTQITTALVVELDPLLNSHLYVAHQNKKLLLYDKNKMNDVSKCKKTFRSGSHNLWANYFPTELLLLCSLPASACSVQAHLTAITHAFITS